MSPPVVTGGPLVATGILRWVASTGKLSKQYHAISWKPLLLTTSRERPNSALYLRLKIVKGGGGLWDFLTSIVLQNIERNEVGTLWCNPKNFKKKSHSAEKKWG